MVKKGLGKGLDALFPQTKILNDEENINNKQTAKNEEDSSNISEIEISKIITNKGQPRKIFDEEKIEELSKSIKKFGVIQPIVLVKKDNKYELIAGERRLRAAIKADFKTIPAVIKEYDDKTKNEVALIENIQRQDLSILEEAQAYKEIMDKYSLSQEELASNIGKSRSSISNSIRLLKLSDKIKEYINSNLLSEGHCKVIVSIPNVELQEQIAEKVVNNGLSVRQLESLIDDSKEKQSKQKEDKRKQKNIWIKDLEDRFKSFFNTKVEIKHNSSKNTGKIIVDYYSNDELDRILEVLNRG